MNLLVLLKVGGAVLDCTSVMMGTMEEPLSSCEKEHVSYVKKRAWDRSQHVDPCVNLGHLLTSWHHYLLCKNVNIFPILT